MADAKINRIANGYRGGRVGDSQSRFRRSCRNAASLGPASTRRLHTVAAIGHSKLRFIAIR